MGMTVPASLMVTRWFIMSLHGKCRVAIGTGAKHEDRDDAKPTGQVDRKAGSGELFKQLMHLLNLRGNIGQCSREL